MLVMQVYLSFVRSWGRCGLSSRTDHVSCERSCWITGGHFKIAIAQRRMCGLP